MVVVAEVAAAGLPTTVTLADVVAVHADPDDVPDDGADPDDDLGWYATQEIADLLRVEASRTVRRVGQDDRARGRGWSTLLDISDASSSHPRPLNRN